MSEAIILQAMEDDYVESCDLDRVVELIETADRRPEEVLYFNIHLGEISSEAGYLYCVFRRGNGFVVMARIDGVVYLAAKGPSITDVVEFSAGDHELRVPSDFFVSKETAQKCVETFCRTSTMASNVNWIRYDELEFDMYC